jgi:adenylosuccinate synthase
MTKLDVLDGLDVIRVCVGYRIGDTVVSHPPPSVESYAEVEAVYEELPGWKESTIGVRAFDELPVNARRYLDYVQKAVDVPIDLISTGPERDQTIVLRHPFHG